jgi:AcrR family transcriptional regulator
MAASDIRQRILGAALASFLEDGYERTTIARVRERSGASNGSLFHHFPTKEALADALFVEAMASFQEGLWDLVRRKPRSLRAAVRGTIAHQLGWIEENADLARFLYMRGQLDWDSPAGSQVAALNRDLGAAFKEWMTPFVDAGEIRAMSMLTITAIVTGPGHSIAQRWLTGQLDARPSEFVDDLADSAWAGLRGSPVTSKGRRPAPASRGRVSLELLSNDGTLVAQGEATADLAPVAQASAPTGR